MTQAMNPKAIEPGVVNVCPIINEAKFQKFHWLTIFWCAYIIIFDGYDLAVLGVILPSIMTEWNLSGAAAGLLGSYTLIGMMVGALSLSALSDKLGKKKVITICVLLFSIFTFLCAFATTPTQFGLYRFIGGVGLGGVMPVVTSLTSEYSPIRRRSLMVGVMFSGYSVGGMLAAILGIWVIPAFGWQAMFYIAIFPVLLLPLMLKQLPESAAYMVQTQQWEKIGATLRNVNPNYHYEPGTQFSNPSVAANNSKARIVIRDLFLEGRMLSTLMLWAMCFMALYVVYGMTSWLPRLMLQAGYPLGSSLSFLFTVHFGTVLGALSCSWLMDHFNGRNVLVIYLFVAAAAIAALGFATNSVVLYTLLTITGATTIGTQIGLYAFIVRFYPTTMSSTGMGWALGVGRLGAIIGPFAVGLLFDLNLTLKQNFFSFAIPALLAAIFMSLVSNRQTAS
ncbi:MFS transporter [Paenalcaligenes suwonensis]|uniref:MFS transporter n=1 Tax=Paenalcaligenes suwonensis TaxID=1202713 RepID=UPI001A99207F|nr:MFS transporter [Paenalcaligenes suwonensis]